jgi:hypothetical protein
MCYTVIVTVNNPSVTHKQFQRPTDKGSTHDEVFPSLMAVDLQRLQRYMGEESRKKKIRAEETTENY